MAEPHERVLNRVEPSGDCWIFTGSLTGGYGRVGIGSRTDGTRRNALAHRVVFEALVGPVPLECILHHVCCNTACVNPAHLEVTKPGPHTTLHKSYGARCRVCGEVEWTRRADGRRACKRCDRDRHRVSRAMRREVTVNG